MKKQRNTLSHADLRLLEMEFAKQAIARIFNWSEGHYANYQYAKGLKYIALYYKGTGAEGDVEGSKIFWAWWRNSWLNRDKVFLKEPDHGYRNLRMIYVELHDPSILVQEITPPKTIWKELKQIAETRKKSACEEIQNHA